MEFCVKKYQHRFLFLILLFAAKSFALEQHEKLWLAVNIQKPITEDKNGNTIFFSISIY